VNEEQINQHLGIVLKESNILPIMKMIFRIETHFLRHVMYVILEKTIGNMMVLDINIPGYIDNNLMSFLMEGLDQVQFHDILLLCLNSIQNLLIYDRQH